MVLLIVNRLLLAAPRSSACARRLRRGRKSRGLTNRTVAIAPTRLGDRTAPGKPLRRVPVRIMLVGIAAILTSASMALAEEEANEAPAQDATEESVAAAAEDDAAAAEEVKGANDLRSWFSGELRAGFDGEWANSYKDVDLDQSLRLNIDPPQWERLHLRSWFWIQEDLDSSHRRGNVLNGISDSYSSDTTAHIRSLYLEVDDIWGDSTLRLGRQRITDGLAFNRIDGVYFKKRMARWDWYAFGGWRASLYDEAHDDTAFGGGASVRLTDSTRVALDFYQADEERCNRELHRRGQGIFWDLLNPRYCRRSGLSASDSVVSASVWQDVTPNLRVSGRFEWHDGDADELMLRATGYISSWDLLYEATYRGLFNTAKDRVSDRTAFYRVLDQRQEYDDFLVAVHKPLTKKIVLSLEGQFHEVESGEWPWTNRDYRRFGASLDTNDLLWDLDTGLAVEFWDVDGRDGAWSVSGEVTKAWESLRLTVGAGYDRYTDEYTVYNPWPDRIATGRRILTGNSGFGWAAYTPFWITLLDESTVEVNDDIYWVDAACTRAFGNNQEVSLRVMFEHDDTSESPYWQVRANYSLRF